MFSSPKQDKRYFVSESQYNCPFCSTASVRYKVVSVREFHWSESEKVKVLYIQCQEPNCQKVSIHFTKLAITKYEDGDMYIQQYENTKNPETGGDDLVPWRSKHEIDEAFFYHHPNSSFVIDNRIPEKIREALDEASTCQKMNLQIGASASLRKTIFQLLSFFEIPKTKKKEKNGKEEIIGLSYLDRLDLLKEKVLKENKNVDESLLDGIKKIYSLVSVPLHERLQDEVEMKDFTPAQFKFLAGIVHSLLIEIFVEKGEREERNKLLSELAKLVPGLNKPDSVVERE